MHYYPIKFLIQFVLIIDFHKPASTGLGTRFVADNFEFCFLFAEMANLGYFWKHFVILNLILLNCRDCLYAWQSIQTICSWFKHRVSLQEYLYLWLLQWFVLAESFLDWLLAEDCRCTVGLLESVGSDIRFWLCVWRTLAAARRIFRARLPPLPLFDEEVMDSSGYEDDVTGFLLLCRTDACCNKMTLNNNDEETLDLTTN